MSYSDYVTHALLIWDEYAHHDAINEKADRRDRIVLLYDDAIVMVTVKMTMIGVRGTTNAASVACAHLCYKQASRLVTGQ